MSDGKTNCVNVYYSSFVNLKFHIISSTPTVYESCGRLYRFVQTLMAAGIS